MRCLPENILLVLLAIVFISAGCNQSESKEEAAIRFIDPRSQEFLQLGTQALEENNFELAFLLADSAEAYTPELADAAFLKGRIFSAIGLYDEADSLYSVSLDRVPDYRGVWHNMGNNDFRRNQFEEAVQDYWKEIALHPEALPWRGMGRAFVELGKVDSAQYAFNQAISLDSTYAPAHFNLALLLEDEGRFDEALHHAQKASDLNPLDLDYRYLRASLLVTNEYFTESIPHLNQVITEWPWHPASHYKLGQSLIRTGMEEEGQAILEKAETLRAQDAKVNQLLNSARGAPGNALAHAALGSALRLVGRYEDAMRAYKIAEFLDPSNLEVQTNMANLLLLQGDTLGTIQGYQQILQQDPSFTGIWVNLGIVHAMSGQMPEAKNAWERALVSDPDNEAAKAYLARLE